jgi:signal peptidase II
VEFRFWLALIVAVEIGLDQWSKAWAVGSLGPDRQIAVVPTVDFDLSYNSGFSFGTGSGQGRFVAVLVMVMIAALVRYTWRQSMGPRAILLAVILGGALGNLTDRVLRSDDGWLTGRVVDFIDVRWYAVFNVADVFVVGGVVALFMVEVVKPLWARPVVHIDEIAET